jgi:hypothetical protein
MACVDHISLVVQYISNTGHDISDEAVALLDVIKKEYLVDDLIEYRPDLSLKPLENEMVKRQIGLRLAQKRGLSHFLTMDADEFYDPEQFRFARQYIEEREIAVSSAHTYLYIKRPIWRSEVVDITKVCFITRIDPFTTLKLGDYFPTLVDPTRRINGRNKPFHLFDAEDVVMHHMNLVRNNMESKLINSSNAHMADFMNEVRKTVSSWQFGSALRFPNKPPIDIIEVENKFGLPDNYKI